MMHSVVYKALNTCGGFELIFSIMLKVFVKIKFATKQTTVEKIIETAANACKHVKTWHNKVLINHTISCF
jgi:hypothetical protein